MRRLLPSVAGEVDLDEAYAWPDGPRCVRGNMVASLDGAAVVDGVSGTLSGPADRRLFAVLRGLAELILVGAATVRRENYGGARPNAARQARRRAAGLADAPPIAMVSRSLDVHPAARFFTDTAVRPLVITCASSPAERRVALAQVAEVVLAGEEAVDLGLALDHLAALGYGRVLCEGGPHLLAEMVAGDHLHELCLTVSPLLVAGPAGRVLAGTDRPRPARLRLLGALEEEGALFLRYGWGVPKTTVTRPPGAREELPFAK